jgi:hypothetical protein
MMGSQINFLQDGDLCIPCCHLCHRFAFQHSLHFLQHRATQRLFLGDFVPLAGSL